jgi:hypothetical protein
MSKDITSVRVLYLKAALFLVVGVGACAIVLLDHPSWKVAGLLAVAAWAFARAYYFAFYVIERYADSGFRYSGLIDLGRYLVTRRRRASREREDR